MGRLRSTGTRRLLRVLALAILFGGVATWALAAGPGGWDHLDDRGTPGSDSLDFVASALEATPGALYVGGGFTDAGGIANADRIAKWNGSSWSAVGPSAFPGFSGSVNAIAVAGARVFVGGTFQNAAGNANADFLAVWNGTNWAPFCNPVTPGPAFDGNVTSLQIIGQTLYVGGEFHDGAGRVSADSLLACDLASGDSRTTVVDEDHAFSGSVYALTADSNGTLYAGGLFTLDVNQIPATENVAALPVGDAWEAMGPGVTSAVRGLTTVGTNVYVGTDALNVAGIPQADKVARWDGSAWHAVGANRGGTNGWFPSVPTDTINSLAGTGSYLFVTGSFLNANGEGRADNVAFFDGTNWYPVGSDGAGNGPWSGTGFALAFVDRQLYAAGSFTSAGGDPQAHSVASFALTQVIAYPTPVVTQGPSPAVTPTVTPPPATTAPLDVKAPRTLLRRARIDQAKRKATFRFASGEAGSKFVCKLDKKKYKPCTSPKTYRKLKRGKHVFRVKARDRAGNVDRTPVVRRFKIKR